MKVISIFLSLLSFSIYASQIVDHPVDIVTHDSLTLSAKISYPATISETNQLPAIILIHGSGLTDMDLTIPASMTSDQKTHHPFKELAYQLSEAGYVVLRYNKRGVIVDNEGNTSIDADKWKTMNVTNLTEDVKSAFNKLKSFSFVHPQKIFLLGISEGTVLAPLAAQQLDSVAGLILLSSVAGTLKDSLYYQLVERQLNLVKTYVDLNHDGFIIKEEAAKFPEISLPISNLDYNQDEKLSMAEIKSVLLYQFYISLDLMLTDKTGTSSDWFKQHFSLAPNYQTIAKFKNPILMIQGELDMQTPLEEALLIDTHLTITEHTNHQLFIIPNVGHVFSPNLQKLYPSPTFGPMSDEVSTQIIDWLNHQN